MSFFKENSMTTNKRVYLLSGRKVELLEKLASGKFLVQGCYETGWDEYDDGPYIGEELIIADEVFDKAPTEIMDKKILILNAEIKELEDAVNDTRSVLYSLENENKEAIEKHQEKHRALEFLNDFLDGKLTHYVITGWFPRIHGVGKPERDHLDYDRPFKLITLFGAHASDKNSSYSGDLNLNWRVNEYRDGSGTWRGMIPCTSLEHAKEELKKCNDENLKNENISVGSYVDICTEYGLECPQKYIDLARADLIKKNDEKLEKIDGEMRRLGDERKLIDMKYKEAEAIP